MRMICIPILAVLMCQGCYEEVASTEVVEEQAPAPPPRTGPVTDAVTGGGGGSALGGAMRTANSIIDDAERASSDVAAQAGEE